MATAITDPFSASCPVHRIVTTFADARRLVRPNSRLLLAGGS
jgi:hypothetical protein